MANVILVSCGDSYEKKGVHIVGVGKREKSRLLRMTKNARMVYQAAVKLDADFYHFHDPELLPFASRLKKRGKIVIFDSHEDVPAQIMDKPWIPEAVRKCISEIYKKYETHVIRHIDAVVAATPYIAEQFSNRAKRVIIVNNYPKLSDVQYHQNSFNERVSLLCYAGGINDNRGESIMKDAMKSVHGTLLIAGDHKKETDGNVIYIGLQNRQGINELYKISVCGLCILKPIENYFYSQPIKMYEYMAAGLPFVCSDFPLWREVVNKSGGGICVDPANTNDISEAIEYLLNNRAIYENGSNANTGIFGKELAHFGYAGIVVAALCLLLFLLCVKSSEEKNGREFTCGLSLYLVIGFADAGSIAIISFSPLFWVALLLVFFDFKEYQRDYAESIEGKKMKAGKKLNISLRR